ncbi:MAG TPA: response regulator transcription factor [bacterium]|nr:response regulator transcription factor [bacterium]
MIRVLVADDHAIVRKGLIQILHDAPESITVDEAASGQEALERIRKETYDAVVLDISMPGRSGIDTLGQIKAAYPGLPVLILSMYPEEQYALRVLKAGASGYLMKESAPDALISAVLAVSQGRKYITPSLAETLATRLETGADPESHERLSDREFEVFLLIAKGQSIKDIAGSLFLSVKTVHTYRARILDKMHLKGTADIIHYAVQYRLIE